MGRHKDIDNPYNRSEYFKSYYESNRGKMSSSRKDRYKNDEEYREKAIASARKYRERKKLELKELVDEGLLSKQKRIHKTKCYITIGDEEIEAIPFNMMSLMIGRSRLTSRMWINSGIMPDTPFKINGRRFYTPCMVSAIIDAIDGVKMVRNKEIVYSKIINGWDQCGISMDMITKYEER